MADVSHLDSDGAGVSTGPVVVSVDAMGGDQGPKAVVAGLEKSAQKNPRLSFLLHGPLETLEPLVAKQKLSDRVEIRLSLIHI